MRPCGVATTGGLAAAAICFVVVSMDIGYQNKNLYKKDTNRIRRRMDVVGGRRLHDEVKTEWHKPDLHNENGGHHIVDAVPIDKKQQIVDARPIDFDVDVDEDADVNADADVDEHGEDDKDVEELSGLELGPPAEGRNAPNDDIDYDEVMLHAQVMPDDYETESPTAAPVDLGSAQRSPDEDADVEICISEVCFLESTAFNNAYDKCDGSDDAEACIETSYLTWKENMLGINLPDPIGTGDNGEGTGTRPVGEFVAKNKAKTNRRKRNKKKKTQGGLNDEQLIATGTGVKGSTAFGNKRDRRKRKNAKNKNKKMYWGDRRWKKQGKMPADVTLKIDDDVEMTLQFDLQELGLASQGEIPIDVVYGDLSTVADAADQENVGIKGQSSSVSSPANEGNTKPQRVPRDPVPEECRLARKIYDDAVAELIRCDEILIKKSHEMEASPMCTEGSGHFDAPSCLGVLKQVRQDIDQVKRGVANDRDEAKKRINEYCYLDSHDFSLMAGSPNDGNDSIHWRSAGPPLLAAPSPANGNGNDQITGLSSHSLNKDDELPQDLNNAPQVHDDNHVFSDNDIADEQPKTALPLLVQSRTSVDASTEATSSSLNKSTTTQDATSTTVVLDEHVVPTDGAAANNHDALLADMERCKSATKILKEKRDKVQELENELQKKLNDDEDYQNIQRQIGRIQQMLDETKAEKLLYCSHGKKM